MGIEIVDADSTCRGGIEVQFENLRYQNEDAENIRIKIENTRLLKENENLLKENEKLREIFQFATVEFDKRNKKIETLEKELFEANLRIKSLTDENKSLQKRLQEEQARNNILNKMVFGRKNEKKKEETQEKEIVFQRGATQGHKGHGRKIPENLPVVEEIIDLKDEEKFCSFCGSPYIDTGLEEISNEICVEKKYYILKRSRKIYKKSCNCKNPIITAPNPVKLIKKGKFSTEFWIDVLINKYKNHLPIERQISDMKEYGLSVSGGSLFGGLKKIYFLYIERLYETMKRSLRKAFHFHADESGWHLFSKVEGKENYNWFIWVFTSQDIVLFVLHPSRSAEVPLKTLFDIEMEDIEMVRESITNSSNKKIMNVDKFSSYKMLQRLGLVELAFCWSHQRREFIQAKIKYPEVSKWADAWVERIGELYHINNERIKYTPESFPFEEHNRKLKEKIKEIYSFINMEYNHPGQIAVMRSMLEHRIGLTLFVDNPEIPMDNNLAERMLRPMVLGRKNYWGNHSLWAGEITCAMFSIVQTCQIHKISPRGYLTYYFNECLKKELSPDEIELLLPHKLSEKSKGKIRDGPN